MLTALKELFGSKTTWLVIIGSAVVTALGLALPSFGLSPEQVTQILAFVAGLFGIKGVQQASADFGKNQATPKGSTVKG